MTNNSVGEKIVHMFRNGVDAQISDEAYDTLIGLIDNAIHKEYIRGTQCGHIVRKAIFKMELEGLGSHMTNEAFDKLSALCEKGSDENE